MIILIAVAFSLAIVYIFYRLSGNGSSVPKGLRELPLEKGYPIVGILPQIEFPQALYLAKLGKKHGPIFRARFGMRDVVVLNNFDCLKKALKDNGEAFSGRFQMEFFSAVIHNCGIIFTDGEKWAKQRSFILTVLRDFGLGKARSQEIVQSECQYLLEELREMEGKCVDFNHLIPVYTANIISKFISNKRFSREDPKLQSIVKVVIEISKSTDFVILFNVMFPLIERSKLFSWLILTVTSRWNMFENAYSCFRADIEEHRQRFDPNSEGEDLIDRFLIKQHQMKNQVGHVDTFTEWQLIRNCFELFSAGYETTSTTLGWSMFFMARFPEVQEKTFLEINDQIGNERMPGMSDRKSLNYTQAVMDEIARLGSVAPVSISHWTLKDTSVNGYFVPKGSLILPNLLACHIDPNTWENPMQFNPERFLSFESEGGIKYCPREELIPFSLGKRQCLGESLARMEYFIFFTSILQHFKVTFPRSLGEKEYESVLRGNDGFIRFAKINDFIFSPRH